MKCIKQRKVPFIVFNIMNGKTKLLYEFLCKLFY